MRATILLQRRWNDLEPMAHALWSAGNQSVRDHEVILVAASQTPEQIKTLRGFCEDDPRRKLVEHPSPSEARRMALEMASGSILFELRDCDLYLPWHLERLIANLQSRPSVRCTPLAAEAGGKLTLRAHEWPHTATRARVVNEPETCTVLPFFSVLTFGQTEGLAAAMLEWRERMQAPHFERDFIRAALELAALSRGDWSADPGVISKWKRGSRSVIYDAGSAVRGKSASPLSTTATIIIPTTGDRAPLVEQALWSISRQTVQDFEVFIIGDGVAESSSEKIRAWSKADSRIRYFDHPKHARRGEIYRHEALQEARGGIVCYLCDRDLYLPWHLERMLGALQEADFVYSLPITITEKDEMQIWLRGRAEIPACRRRMTRRNEVQWGIPLSMGAHRLDAYRSLPEGWSTTPEKRSTDLFMWAKFLGAKNVKAKSIPEPTVLYLPRNAHPGWAVEARLGEMLRWRERMERPGFETEFRNLALETVLSSQREWTTEPLRTWSRIALSSARRRAVAAHGESSLRAQGWRRLESLAEKIPWDASETGPPARQN